MGEHLTPNQQEYRNQQQRLMRAISKIRKEGIFVSPSVIPEMPKKVEAKHIKQIKSITPKQLREQAAYHFDVETGEVFDNGGAIDYAQEMRNMYPTLTITDALRERILALPNARGFRQRGGAFVHVDMSGRKNGLLSLLDDAIAEDENIEERLAVNMERIFEELDKITFYDSDNDAITLSFVNLAVLIKGSALSQHEAEELDVMSNMGGGYEVDED